MLRQSVVLLALLLAGCGSAATLRVGQPPKSPGPPGVDQEVVEALVCAGREGEARVYVEDRGGSRADITERVVRAGQACALRKASEGGK